MFVKKCLFASFTHALTHMEKGCNLNVFLNLLYAYLKNFFLAKRQLKLKKLKMSKFRNKDNILRTKTCLNSLFTIDSRLVSFRQLCRGICPPERITLISSNASIVNFEGALPKVVGINNFILKINPLRTIVPNHIENSQLICKTNQLIGFCMIGNIGR